MIFVIPGDPIANARPRKGKWGMYDPQAKLKKQVKAQLLSQKQELTKHDNVKIDEKAVYLPYNQFYEVELTFYLPIPKNLNTSEKNKLSWNCIENDSNKDLDNLEKFILDCATEILYPDDRYVTSLRSKRFSSENPKTVIIMKHKKSLSEEICGILGIFSRSEMSSLLEDLEDIFMLYDVDPKDDWVTDAVGSEDERNVRLSRTAYLLSKLAEHADKLKQIKRKFGGFHQRCKTVLQEQVNE